MKDQQSNPAIPAIPVFVLTGFLGSGKTTLLNEILKGDDFKNAAVIVNEFGEIGLDHHLIETADDTIIELSNGCLCCTIRGQLIETIEDLLQRKPEKILIETTGIADPLPVLQALIASPSIQGNIEFRGIFTVLDACYGLQTIQNHCEAKRQLALADQIIISKLDKLDPGDHIEQVTKLKTALSQLNPNCLIKTKEQFIQNLPHIFQSVPGTFERLSADSHKQPSHHSHNKNISSQLLTYSKPIEKIQLDMFFDLLLSAQGDHILRVKGLANVIGETRPMVIQGVGKTMSKPAFLKAWPKGDHGTKIVVFTDNIKPEFVERLFAGFMNIPLVDSPDKAALTDNPLAIPGL